MNERKSVLVIGAGDATGGAIARRFAREGYTACVTRRTADKLEPLVAEIHADGGKAHGFASRCAQGREVVALVEQIEARGRPDRGAGLQHRRQRAASAWTETARKYFKVWEMGCLGRLPEGARGRPGAWCRAAAARSSSPAPPPRCAAAPTSPPSPAPSTRCARWPRAWRASSGRKGIHVAHVVVDGAIDTEFIGENFPERYALKDRTASSIPTHIAENYWMLHRQPRDAWTHELDLRPWMEKFWR